MHSVGQQILYEDNHLIIVNKLCGQLVQGDQTGDVPLVEIVKSWLKKKYHKPGRVFLGVVHRLDRPTSGVVVFARTSKALKRMNKLFQEKGAVNKTYVAIVDGAPVEPSGSLQHYLKRNRKQNKSYASSFHEPGSKKGTLSYRYLGREGALHFLKLQLLTGRHHQIRAQLSAIGLHIRGDLKYGYLQPNPDGGIDLHARKIEFIHPVSGEPVVVVAPAPFTSPEFPR